MREKPGVTLSVPGVDVESITTTPTAAEVQFEAWFVETFHGVPGLTTEIFNRFRIAADDFKARLRAGGQ